MNKIYLYIAGILTVVVIGSATFTINKEASQPASKSAQNLSYYDYVTGDLQKAVITYTSYHPDFSEKVVAINSDKQKTSNADLIAYDLQTDTNEAIHISIDKKIKQISVKGLNPQEKISIIKDSKYILSQIPSDWSGKITLTTDDLEISNGLCLELLGQNITACHAKEQNEGGVS